MGKISSRFARPSVRLLLLGLDAAGKTTVLTWLKRGTHHETVPTIGFNVEEIVYKKIHFLVWDVGGQDRLRALWRPNYRGTSGILFVVDSSDTARLNIAKQELLSLTKEEALRGATFCILANKQDLPHALKSHDLYSTLGVTELESAGHICTVIPTVANKGVGIDKALEWLSQNAKPI